MKSTLFNMIHEVLADTREKLAEKTAAATSAPAPKQKVASKPAASPALDFIADAEKVAQACDFLAENIHNVVDLRSPKEKLAEYAAIHEALLKEGFALGGPGEPGLTAGVGPGGPQSALPTMANTTPGGAILEGGDSGQAVDSNVPPKTVEPSEKPTPASTPNALATNLNDPPGGTTDYPAKLGALQKKAQKLTALVASGQIRKEAAAVLIKQAMQKEAILPGAIAGAAAEEPGYRCGGAGYGALGGLGGGVAGGLAGSVLAGTPGAIAGHIGGSALGGHYLAKAVRDRRLAEEAAEKQAMDGGYCPPPAQAGAAAPMAAQKLADSSGAPPKLASALLKKFAEDAINPAQISAGTTPELQDVPGTNSAQMQGSEAGQLTPDTRGDMSGRQLVSSNEAAINATKKDAKHSKTQSSMASLLNEPAMSAAHDNVLQKSLDNASSAGVKIAAASARAMLSKWAGQSSQNSVKLAQILKRAAEEDAEAMPQGAAPVVPPAAAPMPGAAPGMNAVQGAEAAAEPPVSDEAMLAASEGVTPEELAAAHELLAAAEEEAAPVTPPATPPAAGAGPAAAEGSA